MTTTVNGGVSQVYSNTTLNALKNFQASEYGATYRKASSTTGISFTQSIFNTSGYTNLKSLNTPSSTTSLSGNTAGTGKTNTSSISAILKGTNGSGGLGRFFKGIQSSALGQSSIFEQKLNGEAGAFYGKTTSYFRSTTGASSTNSSTASSSSSSVNSNSISKINKSESVSDLMSSLGSSFSLMA